MVEDGEKGSGIESGESEGDGGELDIEGRGRRHGDGGVAIERERRLPRVSGLLPCGREVYAVRIADNDGTHQRCVCAYCCNGEVAHRGQQQRSAGRPVVCGGARGRGYQ